MARPTGVGGAAVQSVAGRAVGEGPVAMDPTPVDATLLAMDAATSELGAGTPELLLEGRHLRAPPPEPLLEGVQAAERPRARRCRRWAAE
jgi:hypothetical protein